MPSITQPLRDEHRGLLPQVEILKEVADAAGESGPGELLHGVNRAYDFLAGHLIPHATAEEEALYPAVGRLMGAARATATMSRDHVEVGRLTHELATLRRTLAEGDISGPEVRDLRRVLYGLYALIHVHFAKEEEVYLPLLDEKMTAAEAAEMFKAMEAAAGHAKAHVH